MPRGIPNAKRDESAMRYTSFHVPLPPNPKHLGSTYLKSDSQTLWARNAARSKGRAVTDETGSSTPTETRRGSRVLVIHPGSRFLRVGRACDVNPISVPNVIARKHKRPVPVPTYIEGISRPREDRSRMHPSPPVQNGDEYAVTFTSDDPFDVKVAAITVSLRDRMRFYKLRVTPNAPVIASTFNEQFKPEIIPEMNDPDHISWIQTPPEDEVLIGEKALHLADPAALGYVVRWPLYGGKFNTRDYPSTQLIVSDLEAILRTTLKERLSMDANSYKESLAATYGAGISNACVVDMGAVKTSIACVDDGLVLPDTRMTLSMGGDDITEFLYVLLERISFPYRDMNLARSYDWNIMEDLKARLCTLAEAILLSLRAARHRVRPEARGLRPLSHPDVTEEVVEQTSDHVTQAMVISTQHLLPSAVPPAIVPPEQPQSIPTSNLQTPEGSAQPGVSPQPAQEDAPTDVVSTAPSDTKEDVPVADVPPATENPPAIVAGEGTADAPMEIADDEGETKPVVVPAGMNSRARRSHRRRTLAGTRSTARAAGGDEKIRKYLQAVLVVGGTALVPGMAHALESRLQAIATPLVPNMEKVQIIPPPKEVDPRVLAWKGAAVLGKMDGVADLWITPQTGTFLVCVDSKSVASIFECADTILP
ncbi:putative actin-related protein 8 [Grifola frondosa]|uniref:Putative actin-related protein 8 n=1 Tax=Grifola frondosa TaxID=5627 RepID=A0A1C7MAW2_GRIFR|nr:putative actin-related protein 8 [Grifola frondosa]